MGKILVVAEKHSAAVDMAKVLNCTDKKKGYIESNKYIVTWASGHLIGLKMPEEHDTKLKEWKMEFLPIVFNFDSVDSLKILPNMETQFEVIKKLIHRKDVDFIINAGDAGREGYLIQNWIYKYAGNKKPVKILWASSLTDEALKKAFANLKEEDTSFQNLLQEAEARAQADYLLGMNYSRILTLTKSSDITLSYGRCQTPLLNLIVQRDMEIENFVPKPYFQIQVTYDKEFKGMVIGEDEKPLCLDSKETAENLVQEIRAKKAIVVSCEKEKKQQKAPLLFSLAELQKEMGRRFQYTPDQTLEIVQKLYETYKMVSYPRTDSCCLSMDLYNEVTEHIKCCNFGSFQQAIQKINLTQIKPDKSYFNDAKVTDHHALIPTINDNMEAEYQKLNIQEKNVFEAILYRFLAIFYPPYEYSTTVLITEIEKTRFKSKGIMVQNLGYKELLKGTTNKEKKEDQEQIPLLEKGDTAEIIEISVLSKKTTPPPKYTIESIITLMQKHQIGTPATMAEIINKLQNPKRQSIVLENGSYHSTSLGRKYISVVPENLKSPELTKNIEEKLSSIGNGRYTKKDFLEEIITQITDDMKSIKKEAAISGKETIGTCPLCKTPVMENRFSYNCQTSDCFKLGKTICEKNISKKIAQDLLNKGNTTLIKGFKGKTGKTFDAKLIFSNGKITFEFPKKKT